MTRILLLALLLAPLVVQAQTIFRTTDEHGNVIFTDSPANTEQAEAVELQRTNTTPAPPDVPEPIAPRAAPEEAATASYEVRITDPVDETSIPMGPGNFSVTARVEPALGQEDSLQLFIDTIPWGDPQLAKTWHLTNILRGQHDITVAIINADGDAVVSSEPIRVFVHRPSVNFRNRQ